MAQLPPLNDTNVAIASAPGTGAVGVVRLSGPQAYQVADKLFRPMRGGAPSTRPAGRVVYGRVVAPRVADPAGGNGETTVDEALLLTFKAPKSYTAQDVVELQTHGGPAVLRYTLDLCVEHGARLAEPGEFTLRAYLNGRIDLLQAESVLEMVNAQTSGAMRNAALGLGGALTQKLGEVQTHLTGAYAAVQASFDYPEEGVPEAELEAPAAAASEVAALLATAGAGGSAGRAPAWRWAPQRGQVGLLNALLGYERSIVSDTPAHRDYLEAPLVLAACPSPPARLASASPATPSRGAASSRRGASALTPT